MTSLRERIHEAADDAPVPDGLLSAVRVLARRRQRQRVAYTAVGAAATVTAAVVVVVGLRSPLDPTTRAGVLPSASVPSAPAALVATSSSGSSTAATTVRCDGYRFDTVATTSIAPALRLLSNDSAFTLQGPIAAHRQQGSCGSTPLALAYEAVSGNRVTSTLRLSGPTVSKHDVAGSSVTVRGITGQLAKPAGGLLLGWTENKQTWTLYASGLNQAQLMAVADSLTLTGTVTANAAMLPAGLQALPASPQPIDQDMWDVNYRVDGEAVQLDVRTGADAAGLLGAGATVVDVNGHRGEVADEGLTELLVWQPSTGVVAEVSGSGLTPDALVSFAKTLAPVAADDPRLG
jgi:hypothetical protein